MRRMRSETDRGSTAVLFLLHASDRRFNRNYEVVFIDLADLAGGGALAFVCIVTVCIAYGLCS